MRYRFCGFLTRVCVRDMEKEKGGLKTDQIEKIRYTTAKGFTRPLPGNAVACGFSQLGRRAFEFWLKFVTAKQDRDDVKYDRWKCMTF